MWKYWDMKSYCKNRDKSYWDSKKTNLHIQLLEGTEQVFNQKLWPSVDYYNHY